MSSSKQENIIRLIQAICSRVRDQEGYVNKTKLIKYLYLIDIEYFRRHRKLFTELEWVFYDFGPWAYEYNEIFDSLSKSPSFVINERNGSYFINASETKDFDGIFDELEDELEAKRIVDRWADESLNQMLNHIYFQTEPMYDAERYRPLDFSKVHTLEPRPNFILTKGSKVPEKDARRKSILSQTKRTESQSYLTPRYDEIYLSSIDRMNYDDEY